MRQVGEAGVRCVVVSAGAHDDVGDSKVRKSGCGRLTTTHDPPWRETTALIRWLLCANKRKCRAMIVCCMSTEVVALCAIDAP